MLYTNYLNMKIKQANWVLFWKEFFFSVEDITSNDNVVEAYATLEHILTMRTKYIPETSSFKDCMFFCKK